MVCNRTIHTSGSNRLCGRVFLLKSVAMICFGRIFRVTGVIIVEIASPSVASERKKPYLISSRQSSHNIDYCKKSAVFRLVLLSSGASLFGVPNMLFCQVCPLISASGTLLFPNSSLSDVRCFVQASPSFSASGRMLHSITSRASCSDEVWHQLRRKSEDLQQDLHQNRSKTQTCNRITKLAVH